MKIKITSKIGDILEISLDDKLNSKLDNTSKAYLIDAYNNYADLIAKFQNIIYELTNELNVNIFDDKSELNILMNDLLMAAIKMGELSYPKNIEGKFIPPHLLAEEGL